MPVCCFFCEHRHEVVPQIAARLGEFASKLLFGDLKLCPQEPVTCLQRGDADGNIGERVAKKCREKCCDQIALHYA